MKSILDPSFRYRSSAETDLAKTFARIRREQRLAAEAAHEAALGTPKNVSPIHPRLARSASRPSRD